MSALQRGYLRIGELSRRTGVSPELLRAWERRYGLLQPDRSTGGFRLYTDSDEARVRAMQANLSGGLSAAEAARLALSPSGGRAAGASTGAAELVVLRQRLRNALDTFDEAAAQAALDELLAGFSVETFLGQVVMPLLQELGDRWASGDASIAQEHFASNIVRGRLLGLARDWGRGQGPCALLACPPGEQHDLALIVFGLALRARGWRVTFLGADTPIETVAETARALEPRLVVLAAEVGEHLAAVADEVASLARSAPLALAGAGATPELALRAGAQLLREDPLAEADRVSRAA